MRMKLGWQFTTPAYTTLVFSIIIGATKYTIFFFTASKKRQKPARAMVLSQTNCSKTHIFLLNYRDFILEMM